MNTNINDLVAELNTALRGDSITAVVTARGNLTKAIDAANDAAMKQLFTECIDAEHPMKELLTRGTFKCQKVKSTKKDDLETISVEEYDRLVDPVRFEKAASVRVSASPGYIWKLETLARNFLRNVSAEVKADADFSAYKLGEKAVEVGNGKCTVPALIDQVQEIIDGIICIPDSEGLNSLVVSAKDIAFIKAVSFKRGAKIGSVTVAKPRTVLNAIIAVAHKLVTGAAYTVEFASEQKIVSAAA